MVVGSPPSVVTWRDYSPRYSVPGPSDGLPCHRPGQGTQAPGCAVSARTLKFSPRATTIRPWHLPDHLHCRQCSWLLQSGVFLDIVTRSRPVRGRRGVLDKTVVGIACVLRQHSVVGILAVQSIESLTPVPLPLKAVLIHVVRVGQCGRHREADARLQSREGRSPPISSTFVTLTITACESVLLSVSVTTTVTSYTLFPSESPGDSKFRVLP